VQGLTAEDFKRMDREKALKVRDMMDEHNAEEDNQREAQLFMGMTDQEILVNK